MLELVQLNYLSIMMGEGRNNFLLEINPERENEPLEVSG